MQVRQFSGDHVLPFKPSPSMGAHDEVQVYSCTISIVRKIIGGIGDVSADIIAQ